MSNEGALVAQINDPHFWENNVYLQRLNGITLYVKFVYATPLAGTQNSERVKCVEYKPLLRTCFGFERKTATRSARVRTRAANACTKRGNDNSFPGT